MADDAQRGVTFTLKANVDQQAKAEIAKLTQELTQAQEKLSAASAQAAAMAAAAASQATAEASAQAAAAAATAKATVDRLTEELAAAQEKIAANAAQATSQVASTASQAANQASASIQNAAESISGATQRMVDGEEKSAKEIVDSWTQAFNESSQAAQQSADKSTQASTKSASEIAERLKQLEGEKAEIRRVSADKERADYVHAQLALVDITQRRIEAEEKARLAAEKGSSKAGLDPMFYAQELAAEEIKLVEEVAELKKKFIEAEKKEKAFLVDQEIKDLKRLQIEHERSAAAATARNQKIGASTSRIVSTLSEGSEALMRFVNGFQHLGLVGEKDLQKVQDALLRIQGVTGVFTGLIRMFRQASEGIDAYRKIVELTAAAQTAAAAATAADTAATAANTQAHAANVAVRSAGEIPTTTSVVMGAARIGTAVAGAGEAVGIGAASASALTVFGAAVAAFTGMLFAAVSAIQVFKENLKFDFGGGAKEGSFTSNLALSSWNPFSRAFAQGQAFETDTPILKDLAKFIPSLAGMRTLGAGLIDPTGLLGISTGPTAVEKQQLDRDRMEKARGEFRQRTLELQREAEREINQITNERSQILAKQSVAENEMRSARLQSLKPEERRAEIIKEIAGVESNNALSAEDRARKVISMQKERLAVEREISNEQSRAAKEQLRTLEEQANVKDREIEKARAEAMSAAERFGLMTEVEQQNLIDARQRFQAGAGNVDVEELRKLRGFSGAMDEQIAAEARRRAAAAGFGAFQGEDLRRIQQMEAERQQLEVRVKAQADVVARIDVDIEKTAKEINKQIDVQWRVVLQEMAAQISRQTLDIKKIEDALMQRFGR